MSKLRRLSTIDRKRLAEQSPEEAAEYSLFPVLRRMGSEDIRRALGFEYFEELEHAARAASRTVSQYLRLTLTEKLLGGRRRRPGPVVSVAARRPLKHSER